MPSKLIDRINKLIALSASSNENEARNAAFLAAKLIRENGVVLSEKDGDTGESLEDLLDIFRRQTRATRPDPPPRPRPPPRPKEPPRKNPTAAPPSRVRAASQDELNDMFKDE